MGIVVSSLPSPSKQLLWISSYGGRNHTLEFHVQILFFFCSVEAILVCFTLTEESPLLLALTCEGLPNMQHSYLSYYCLYLSPHDCIACLVFVKIYMGRFIVVKTCVWGAERDQHSGNGTDKILISSRVVQCPLFGCSDCTIQTHIIYHFKHLNFIQIQHYFMLYLIFFINSHSQWIALLNK